MIDEKKIVTQIFNYLLVMNFFRNQVKKILKVFGLKLIKYPESSLRQFNFSVLKDSDKGKKVFDTFTTKNGEKYKLYKNYRYNLKKSYLSYSSIRNLFFLINKIKDNKRIISNLNSFIGDHTLTCPLHQINDYANGILKKYSDFFITKNKTFIPKIDEILFKKDLNEFINWTKNYLNFYGQKKKLHVLEIGPGTGMLSISLSILGHNVYAIDKNYHKLDDKSQYLRMKYLQLSDAKVKFINGDILKFKKFKKNYFDLIISISVLEHIKNFPLLLKKLKIILKQPGYLLHKYAHFWSEEGAHSLGNLDAPWLHTILKGEELQRYLKKIRPHEYVYCDNWMKQNLNTKINSSYVQKNLVNSGFFIESWIESKNYEYRLKYLDSHIIRNVLINNPEISLSDLFCSDTTFLAKKI